MGGRGGPGWRVPGGKLKGANVGKTEGAALGVSEGNGTSLGAFVRPGRVGLSVRGSFEGMREGEREEVELGTPDGANSDLGIPEGATVSIIVDTALGTPEGDISLDTAGDGVRRGGPGRRVPRSVDGAADGPQSGFVDGVMPPAVGVVGEGVGPLGSCVGGANEGALV
jgi:hypothetical protein